MVTSTVASPIGGQLVQTAKYRDVVTQRSEQRQALFHLSVLGAEIVEERGQESSLRVESSSNNPLGEMLVFEAHYTPWDGCARPALFIVQECLI